MKKLLIYSFGILVVAGSSVFGAVSVAETNEEPPLEAPKAPAAPHPPRGPQPPREPKGELSRDQEFNLKQLQMNALRIAENAQAAVADMLGGAPAQKQPLFIAGAAPTPEARAAVEEDMSVMARILEKANPVDEPNGRAMGIWVRLPSLPAARNMYIEGQGALFFLHVNFPLLPPKTQAEAEAPAAPPSEWDETKRELNEPDKTEPPLVQMPNLPGARAVEFHQETVDELQARLTMALTNAVHIRALQPEETVTVVVTGQAGDSARQVPSRQRRAPKGARGGRSPELKAEPQLVLRVKRKDIEAFNASNGSPEAFRKIVQAVIY